jgi:hypothetical protein
MSENTAATGNPLQKYFRQPKIYFTLPSNGRYWSEKDLEFTENGEYPVFAMTAKDELSFKTPDSLINGQSTVDVIQSCVPNIKNAWNMPSIDLDAVLVAIRIATYGESMDVDTTVPVIDEERTYQLDLRQILDQLIAVEFQSVLPVGDLVIHLKPLTYREFTNNALKTFEEQRVFSLLDNQEISEEEKLNRFNQSFRKLTELNINMISESISAIEIGEETVQEQTYISEFLQKADRDFYNAVIEHIEKEKEKFAIKPLDVKTEPEDQEKGAPESYQVPVVFDQSNFFG